jgi:glycosyltransferase involved in cell wall biosynthesis
VVGNTALLTRPGDVGDLRDALLKYTKDPMLCERSGEMARKRLDENFSWGTVANRYVNIYEEAIKKRKDEFRKYF